MSVDTQQILQAADKVGELVGQHPAIEKYRHAQKSLQDDPDAVRLVNEFNRHLAQLSRQQEAGMPPSDAQRHQLEALQMQLQSHIKIKALNLAEMDFYDLMRQVSERIRGKLADNPGGAAAAAPAGPRIVS